ncbi:hypothetical protein ACP70R_038186 [Stipagrostis hirtigluma subsp. patula]
MTNEDEDAHEQPVDALGDTWERRFHIVRLVHGCMVMASVVALTMVLIFGSDAVEAATFSVEVAAFEGLNATLGQTVSPAFSLKARVENPRALQPWCSNGGEVVVSYGGVALAWGDVPGFCVRRKAATELTLLPWGKGVGLSEDLQRRLASELLTGTAHVLAEMKLFYDANDWVPSELSSGTSLHAFQLMIRARS